MNDTTGRLTMPMIAPGQAQKEMTHNAALTVLDAAVQASAFTIGDTVPPADPVVGGCWIVGATPGGAWSGHAGKLAHWTAGGWRFLAPSDGFQVWLETRGVVARFIDGVWTVGRLFGEELWLNGTKMLSIPAASISRPVGGTVIDAEARATISEVLDALRHHNLIG